MSWEKTTIGEHCTVTSSRRFHLSERTNSGVPFYCSKEIIQKVNGDEVTDCDYISEDLYESVKKQFGVPEAGELLITTRGTYGIPYIYRDTDRFYFADGNLTWLKDFDETLLPKYLYYWVKSFEGQSKIDAIAKGTAQKAVPIALIKTLDFMLPPIDHQRKIVEILSAYDDLIENNRRQIKLLEEAARRLYREWFVDFRFPGHEQVQIVDGVPEGWKVVKLSEILEVHYGKEHKSIPDGHIPVYGSGGIIRYCAKSLYDGEAILIPRKGTLNNVIFVNGSFWTVDTMFFSVMKIPKVSFYVHQFLLSLDFYKMNTGAAVPSTTIDTVYSQKMILPSVTVVSDYYRVMKSIFSKMHVIKRQISELRECQDAIIAFVFKINQEVK